MNKYYESLFPGIKLKELLLIPKSNNPHKYTYNTETYTPQTTEITESELHDFNEIIIRELSLAGYEYTIENKKIHSQRIYEKYKTLKNDYIKNFSYDVKVVIKANKFLYWLDKITWEKEFEAKHGTDFNLTKKTNKIAFKNYLLRDVERVFPVLVSLFSNAKPKFICYGLIALRDLDFISSNILTSNQSQLYDALKASFGKIGTRQSLNFNLKKLYATTQNDEDQIAIVKAIIVEIYSSVKNQDLPNP